ncbi:MAG TPA: zf-TFIIB domain-containing protein [Longimicrobium sp.]|nr:zf-TFIIB domain-containing protein [Longimicrobium sp.]
MPERPLRLECPVCLGARLATKRVADDPTLEIDHCPRCGGVWFDHGEADELRRLGTPRKLRAVVPLIRGHQRMACRGCEARIQRAAAACDACGHKNVVDCPVCDRPMEREGTTGLRLDVCRGCRGAWFDNGQLRAIWKAQAALAIAPAAAQADRHHGSVDVPLDAAEVVGRLAADGADGLAEGSMHLANAAGSLPEAAGGAFEGAASLLEVVGGLLFDALAAILEGIFGALG